jgi:hypothetical protein
MTVAIVVEPEYRNLKTLVSEMRVWAVESEFHRGIAEGEIWPGWKSKEANDGLTLYKVERADDRVGNCVGLIEMIELHHPAVSSLVLVGLEDSESLRSELLQLGYRVTATSPRLLAERVATEY